ncbi:MAG: aconitase X catalytic domain-containing protein [Smithellaceae bacterium]|nr:aconitase X catalytic domain-containing protein [Smithellaceae bacterium]
MVMLTPDEQEMLEGRQGSARQKAMELLVKYADGLGAKQFVDTNNVTIIAGSIPDITIVEKIVPSLDADEIASKFLLDSDETVVLDKVKAFTTTNATFRDQRYPELQRGGKPHCDLLQKMADYLKRVGVIHMATCTPYQAGNIPMKEEHCAWTESSAVAFCNSVLGGRTNIEGLHSSFASAVTGKTPLWGMHLAENRFGQIIVDVEIEMELIRDWYLLGYYVASQVGLDIPIYNRINRVPDLTRLMALCAAGIASGSIVKFHIAGITPEAPTLEAASGNRKIAKTLKFGWKERRIAYERLNHSASDEVDVVILGCPHAGLDRVRAIAGMLEGKKIHKNTRLYVTTCHPIKNTADKQGYTDIIAKAGGSVWEDSCGLVLVADPSTVFACDSAKMANYLPGETGSKNTWFGTTEECIEAALTGKWRGELK